MADTIDETTIIAWVDGELDEAQTAQVATAVAAIPELTALAERHRRMKARFAASFDALAEAPVALPEPPAVLSFAAAKAERAAAKAVPRRWYAMGGAIAASLVVGVLVGQPLRGRAQVEDKPAMLALSAPLSQALDGQLSGDAGVVRVALSFRDREDHYRRSFEAQQVAGVACKSEGAWRIRYANAMGGQAQGEYRMAGADPAQAHAIERMIASEPLDRSAEGKARSAGWY